MFGHKMMEMFGVKTQVQVKTLEMKSETVFNILNVSKVFGDVEGLRLEVERRGFINSITEHATGDDNHNYLELTYPTGVRLIIHTYIAAGEADIREVTAYDHPWKNENIDYDALNREIASTLLWFGEW